MRYDFTDRSREVLAMAREEAVALQHDAIGTEHMLLGLLSEGRGRGAGVLRVLGVDSGRLRQTVLERAGPRRSRMAAGKIPYTSRGKKVLEFAMAECRDLDHRQQVGTEHLLLGLLAEEKGIAARSLDAAGVEADEVRRLVRERAADDADAVEAAGVSSDREAAWYLEIEADSDAPLYEQIIARIEEAVATSRMLPGERLPSVRDLAAELGIAPGTVARAYSELEARGVVRTEGARGTRVSSDPPGRAPAGADPSFLERLLRKPVVTAFHRGATADQMRAALERAMKGILGVL